MNVLILTAHYHPNLGGVETHLLDLTAGIVKKKHRVFVLTYQPLTTSAKARFYERTAHLEVLRLPYLKGLFYRLVHFPILEFIYLLPGLFIATPLLLLRRKIEVIHAHGIVAGAIGVFWGKLFQKRVVISLHSIYHFPKTGLYLWFVKSILTLADKIFCLSLQSQNEVIHMGIPETKTAKFTYWVDQEKFKPLSKDKSKSRYKVNTKFLVLFVGRFILEKGIIELINSAKYLKDEIIIAFAGDGPLKNKINQNLSSKIRLLGRVSQQELPVLLNAADCLIVPSVHEEGFGRVIIEALSCGTPVIAASRGGIKEAMDDSVGRLITISPQSIAKTIISLYTNPKLLTKLAKNASLFARKKYSERNIEPILESYES